MMLNILAFQRRINAGLIPPGTQSETVTLPASGSTLYVSFRQLSGGVWQPWQYSSYSVQ
jgi:hypothetical protein